MGKREASLFAAQLDGVDVDAPRAKRYKTAATPANQTGTVKDEHGPTNGLEHANGGVKDDPEAVKEKGLKLWQAIKDAVNKECVTLSFRLQRFSDNCSHFFHLSTLIYSSTMVCPSTSTHCVALVLLLVVPSRYS